MLRFNVYHTKELIKFYVALPFYELKELTARISFNYFNMFPNYVR